MFKFSRGHFILACSSLFGLALLIGATRQNDQLSFKDDFGAVCDGSTIDDGAMTRAKLAIGNTTKTLLVSGTCVLSGTTSFVFPGSMSMVGDGNDQAVFKLPASTVLPTGFALFKWTNVAATGVRIENIGVDFNLASIVVPSPNGPVYSLFSVTNCTRCKILNNFSIGQPPNNVIDVLVATYKGLEIAGNNYVQTGTSIHHSQCINTGSIAPNISYNLNMHDNMCDGTGIFAGGDSYNQHIYHNTVKNLCFGAASTTEGQSSYSTDYNVLIEDNIFSWTNICATYDDNETRQSGVENFYANAIIKGNKVYAAPGACITNGAQNVLITDNVCVDSQNLAVNSIYRLTPTGGTGNTPHQYPNVTLTATSGIGIDATATINVGSTGSCDVPVVLGPGYNFVVGDTLSAPASALGGSGTGCTFVVSAIQGGEAIYFNHSNPTTGPVLTFGSLVGGSGGTPGTYVVSLSGGTCQYVTANVTIGVGGSVSVMPTVVSKGYFCTQGNTLTGAFGGITGFSVNVATISMWTANNSTLQNNTVIQDSVAGHTSYCYGDLFAGGVFTNMGTNTCIAPQIGVMDFAGTLNYLGSGTTDNRLYNPCQFISTLAGGAAVTANGAYPTDGWKLTTSTAGRLSAQQTQVGANLNTECTEGLTITQTSASPILAPTSNLELISTYVELSSLLDAQYNSTTPQSYALPFCVTSSLGGQWSLAVQNLNTAASYVTTYRTLSGTTICPQIILPGDTSHSLGFTNSNNVLRIVLDMGSNQSVCTSNLNVWQTGIFYCATNTNSLLNAPQGSTFTITNMALTPSQFPTAVQVRPMAQEIDYAYRYNQTSFQPGTAPANNVGINKGEEIINASTAGTTTFISKVIKFVKPMSKVPTITLYNPAVVATGNGAAGLCNDETANVDTGAVSVVNITTKGFQLQITGASTGAVNDNIGCGWFATTAP